MAEAGWPAAEVVVWTGVMAPHGTSRTVLRRLERAFVDGILSAEHRRNRCHAHRVGAEFVDTEPEPIEIVGVAEERLARLWRELDEQRLEQPLAFQTATAEPPHDPLEQHTLMRHMLVNNPPTIFVHGEDKRIPNLSQRTKRTQGRERRLIFADVEYGRASVIRN